MPGENQKNWNFTIKPNSSLSTDKVWCRKSKYGKTMKKINYARKLSDNLGKKGDSRLH